MALTAVGEERFGRLAAAAVDHDRRLRQGISDDEVALLAELLARMEANVVTGHVPSAPSAPSVASVPWVPSRSD